MEVNKGSEKNIENKNLQNNEGSKVNSSENTIRTYEYPVSIVSLVSLVSDNKVRSLGYLKYLGYRTLGVAGGVSRGDMAEDFNVKLSTVKKTIKDNPTFFEVEKKIFDKTKNRSVELLRLSGLGQIFMKDTLEPIIKEQERNNRLEQESSFKDSLDEQFNIIINILELKTDLISDKNNIILEIDFQKLSEEDPFLTEAFIDNYIDYREKFLEFIKKEHSKEVVIRPINLPESSQIDLSDISSSQHLNKLVKTKAVIEFRSDIKESVCVESKFECPSCGTIITIIQGDFYEDPKKCSCGRKGNFKHLQDKTDDFLEIIVRSKDLQKHRTRMNVHFKGNDMIEYLNKNLTNGKDVEIIGIYKSKSKYERNKKTTKSVGFIYVESIKSIREDFNLEDFSKKDIADFNKLKDQSLSQISKEIFPASLQASIGQEVLSKAWILQMVSGKNYYDESGVKVRNKPHVFVVGDPALDKSRKIQYAKKIDPRIRDVNGASTSSAGLLLGMDTFDNKRFISGGLLAEANNSTIIIDEIQKFDKEARGSLHDVLASQRLKYNKVGFNIEEDVDVAMSFFGNPPKDIFTEEPIYKQIRNPKDSFGNEDHNSAFLSRCDLVIGLRDDKKKDKEIIDIKLKGLTNNEKDKIELIKKFIYYVKNQPEPIISNEAKELFKVYVPDLRTKSKAYHLTLRIFESYMIFSKCYAKLRLSPKIEVCDVLNAHNLFLDSLKSLEVKIFDPIIEVPETLINNLKS